MKVLQVTNSLQIGGAEKLVLDSVFFYQSYGLKVDVLLLSNKQTAFTKVMRNKSQGDIYGLTEGSIYNPMLVLKIIPYLKNYEVVHIHLFPALYWVVIAKLLCFSKAKLIYTEHSTNNKRRSSMILRLTDRFIYSRLDAIVAITEEVKTNLMKHLSFDDSKFHIIENGIDVNLYNTAIPYLKTDFFKKDSFLLIQVSSFRPPKDQNTVIKSLTYLPENIRLLLVGDGPLINDSKKLVESLGLSERVCFLGNRDDVPRLLKTADVVVLSSQYEGLSLSNIEGMSAGLPFIGSDVPGLRDVIKGYGLLFDKGNYEQLACLIAKLYNDKAFYSLVANQCYLRSKDYQIERMIESYMSLFNSVAFSASD